MYQKDYILRMIEMIGDLIRGILGLIKKGEYTIAEKTIENSYQNFLKQDAAFFTAIPLDKLTDLLMQEHNYTIGHLEILGELFYAQAELTFAQNFKKESLTYYEKSLKLIEFIMTGSKSYSINKEERLTEIKNRIKTLKN